MTMDLVNLEVSANPHVELKAVSVEEGGRILIQSKLPSEQWSGSGDNLCGQLCGEAQDGGRGESRDK